MTLAGEIMNLMFIGAGVLALFFPSVGNAADNSIKTGATFKDCRDCPELLAVAPGSFIQGMDSGPPERYEGRPHKVTIAYRFAVGRTEVTTGQFREFVAATGYKAGANCKVWDGKAPVPMAGADWANPGYGRPAADNEPAACVSWDDAKAYVAWLSKKTSKPYRLLSESEWEYVERPGGTGRFAWGDDPDEACITANVADASTKDLKPPFYPRPFVPANCNDGFPAIGVAGALKPNKLGLFDMTGSLWEWVEDCYVMPYPEDTPTDGKPYVGPQGCDHRVAKGGGWGTTIERQRPTFRFSDPAPFVSQIYGFRIARNLSP